MTSNLIEKVCGRENLNRAYKRVKANKGAPGIDGMTVGQRREISAKEPDQATHLKDTPQQHAADPGGILQGHDQGGDELV